MQVCCELPRTGFSSWQAFGIGNLTPQPGSASSLGRRVTKTLRNRFYLKIWC